MAFDYTKNKQNFGQVKREVSAFGKDYEYQSERNKRRKEARKNPSFKERKRVLSVSERNAEELYGKMCEAYFQCKLIPELKYVEVNPMTISVGWYVEQYNVKEGTPYELIKYEKRYDWGDYMVLIKVDNRIENFPINAFKPTKPTEEEVIIYTMKKEIN